MDRPVTIELAVRQHQAALLAEANRYQFATGAAGSGEHDRLRSARSAVAAVVLLLALLLAAGTAAAVDQPESSAVQKVREAAP